MIDVRVERWLDIGDGERTQRTKMEVSKFGQCYEPMPAVPVSENCLSDLPQKKFPRVSGWAQNGDCVGFSHTPPPSLRLEDDETHRCTVSIHPAASTTWTTRPPAASLR
jgi:hypothetical protein